MLGGLRKRFLVSCEVGYHAIPWARKKGERDGRSGQTGYTGERGIRRCLISGGG